MIVNNLVDIPLNAGTKKTNYIIVLALWQRRKKGVVILLRLN